MASFRVGPFTVSVRVYRQPPQCDHEWMNRGAPDDRWLECWLCGTTVEVARA